MSRLLVTEWLMFRLILSGRILVVLCNRLNWLLFIRITVCIPIFNIADNQYLTYELAQEAASKIPAETHFVTLRLGTDGAQSWKAKLDYLSPNVTLTTGTLRLRAELDNPDGMLRPGLFVSVTLPYGEARNAVLVNDASIGTDQLGKYLYVVNDSDIVNYRHIEVGQLADHNMRVVKSGLSPSERYVTKALLKVRQGMKIKPIEQTNKLQ